MSTQKYAITSIACGCWGPSKKCELGDLSKIKVITANERLSNKNVIQNSILKMYGIQHMLCFFAKDVASYCKPN